MFHLRLEKIFRDFSQQQGRNYYRLLTQHPSFHSRHKKCYVNALVSCEAGFFWVYTSSVVISNRTRIHAIPDSLSLCTKNCTLQSGKITHVREKTLHAKQSEVKKMFTVSSSFLRFSPGPCVHSLKIFCVLLWGFHFH